MSLQRLICIHDFQSVADTNGNITLVGFLHEHEFDKICAMIEYFDTVGKQNTRQSRKSLPA